MRIKTRVGQVALVGRERCDQPSGILVDERTSRFGKGRSRGNLYVLVAVSGPTAEHDMIARQVAQTMHDAYYSWQGSVTAGLQRAVREANNLLFNENRNSLPGERRTAGVSCVVLRDDDLFAAQTGPAAIYLTCEEQVTRFPDVSPWLDGIPPEEMDAAPLGDRREVNVALFHAQVSSGDTVLLADGELARRVPSRMWPTILTKSPVEAVLGELLARGKGSDLLALVVRVAEEGAEKVPAEPVRLGDAPERLSTVNQPLRERLSLWTGQLHVGERLRRVGLTLAAALAGLWAGLLTLLKRMMPGQLGPSQTPGRQTTTVSRVEKRARKGQRDRATDAARGGLVQKVLTWVAVAIPLVVAAVVVVTLVQRGQARRAELETLRQQANTHWEQARATSDPATIRTHLTEAEGFLDQLLERWPEDTNAIELQGQIQTQLDAVNRVERTSRADELASYPADADLSRVVVQGAHIFVMDRRNDKVYHHRLDEQLQNALQPDSLETILVSKGQQVGDVVVSDLVDMVWVPTGPNRQRASLVILESGGALLDYDPATGELVRLRAAASETWQFPELVGSHTGRFYLLDSSANKIWRYEPTPDGYSTLPDEWLQTEVDLIGVVDMAVGDSIYLLYADGTIQKLTLGKPDTFDVSDWDSPPRSPAAIFTRPPDDTQWVYVADRGNSRIVQCSKEGQFERQFRLTDSQMEEKGDVLAAATSLFVDEISGHAYLLSGPKLFLLILPMPE